MDWDHWTTSKKYIVLENIRSAYNTWNILRTADALWRTPVLSWFTPHRSDPKVQKTALGAFAEHDECYHFWNTAKCLERLTGDWATCIALEITDTSISIESITVNTFWCVALIVWNENSWVLESTLSAATHIAHIPMVWIKESMNVGQAAAIWMRALQ